MTYRYLRECFHQTKHLQQALAYRYLPWRTVASQARAQHHLMAKMSPSLQGEVAMKVNSKWLARVPWFDGVEKEFLVQVLDRYTTVTWPLHDRYMTVT